MPGQLLDIEAVAEWLCTSTRHVQRLVADKRIPYLKVGHFVRFDPSDVTTWIDNQKVPSRSETVAPPGTIAGERDVAPPAPLSRRPSSAAEVLARWQTGAR